VLFWLRFARNSRIPRISSAGKSVLVACALVGESGGQLVSGEGAALVGSLMSIFVELVLVVV
jgi:hypothetical protein